MALDGGFLYKTVAELQSAKESRIEKIYIAVGKSLHCYYFANF